MKGRRRGILVALAVLLVAGCVVLAVVHWRTGRAGGAGIVIVKQYGRYYELALVHLDGGRPVKLTNKMRALGSHDCSPIDGRIAFDNHPFGKAGQIVVVEADGSNPTNITGARFECCNPVWRPDGKSIAFESLRDGRRAIYVIDPDGKNERKVTAGNGQDMRPVWSPDGKSIAFTRTGGASSGPIPGPDGKGIGVIHSGSSSSPVFFSRSAIYILRLDTGKERQVVPATTLTDSPSWSPDSSQLAYTSALGKSHNSRELHVIAADGAGIRRLTTNSTREWDPVWSPDGKRILFSSGDIGKRDVCIINTDGSGLRKLTTDSQDSYEPCWHPSGELIIFRSERGGGYGIFTMAPDGSSQKRLTEAREYEGSPVWRPQHD